MTKIRGTPWRRWFAWRPVFYGKYGRHLAWLRWMLRRKVGPDAEHGWRWEYRLP